MKLKDRKLLPVFGLVLLLLALTTYACTIQMSMKGASIPENVRTASVQYFENRAPLINPMLSQTFTEELKDRIRSESRLVITNEMGDVDFSGQITGYDLRPMAIQADAISAETRLTISVRVRFQNFKDPKQNWENTFSAYADFESSQSITEIEEQLVADIVDQLTENIFNRAFSDW